MKKLPHVNPSLYSVSRAIDRITDNIGGVPHKSASVTEAVLRLSELDPSLLKGTQELQDENGVTLLRGSDTTVVVTENTSEIVSKAALNVNSNDVINVDAEGETNVTCDGDINVHSQSSLNLAGNAGLNVDSLDTMNVTAQRDMAISATTPGTLLSLDGHMLSMTANSDLSITSITSGVSLGGAGGVRIHNRIITYLPDVPVVNETWAKYGDFLAIANTTPRLLYPGYIPMVELRTNEQLTLVMRCAPKVTPTVLTEHNSMAAIVVRGASGVSSGKLAINLFGYSDDDVLTSGGDMLAYAEFSYSVNLADNDLPRIYYPSLFQQVVTPFAPVNSYIARIYLQDVEGDGVVYLRSLTLPS